jgi:hypothetical protein
MAMVNSAPNSRLCRPALRNKTNPSGSQASETGRNTWMMGSNVFEERPGGREKSNRRADDQRQTAFAHEHQRIPGEAQDALVHFAALANGSNVGLAGLPRLSGDGNSLAQVELQRAKDRAQRTPSIGNTASQFV